MTTHTNIQSSQADGNKVTVPSKPYQGFSPPPLPSPPKRRGWLWVVGLLLAAAAAYFAYRHFSLAAKLQPDAPAASSNPARRGAPTPVIATPARRGNLPIYLEGVGTAQALNMVTIHSRVDGELVKVLYEEGQFVHKDDLMAEMDPRAYEVQLSQAQAQQAKDQAALDNAKRDLERYQIAKEAVPQQQLDTAASQVTQYAAAVKIDQAAIDNAKLVLSYTKITAPISGRMGLRNIDAGNIVHASDPNGLVTITQIQPIAVVVTLAEGSLPQVRKAMAEQTQVAVRVYDTADTKFTKVLAEGTLLALDNQIDLSSGTFKFKAAFDNQDDALFPNQAVNVRLLVDTRQDAVLVPAEAVQRSPQSTFVDVIKEDNTVDQRAVTVGPTEAGMTVVEQGLNDGEMIATSGLDRLQPGTLVVIQSAETTRAGRGNAARSGNTQPSTQRRGRGGTGRGVEGVLGPTSAPSDSRGTSGSEGGNP